MARTQPFKTPPKMLLKPAASSSSASAFSMETQVPVFHRGPRLSATILHGRYKMLILRCPMQSASLVAGRRPTILV
jgi:hypothetical protein